MGPLKRRVRGLAGVQVCVVDSRTAPAVGTETADTHGGGLPIDTQARRATPRRRRPASPGCGVAARLWTEPDKPRSWPSPVPAHSAGRPGPSRRPRHNYQPTARPPRTAGQARRPSGRPAARLARPRAAPVPRRRLPRPCTGVPWQPRRPPPAGHLGGSMPREGDEHDESCEALVQVAT